MRLLQFVPLLLCTGISLHAQDTSTPPDSAAPFKVPDEFAGKSSPFKPTPEGLAHARKMWGYDCAVCHGSTGDGKGDLASTMKAPLQDFRDAAVLKDISDGELFYIIQKGKNQMPAEGDRSKPEDIWTMVAFVRSFSKK